MIIIEYMRQAYLTSFLDEDVRRRTKYLIDTHDVISERCQVLSELGLWSFAPVTAENERNALSVADAIIAIQSHDARKFQALLPTSEVLVAMHPVQARYVSLPCEMDDSNIALGFLGSTNEPNVEAIKDLIAAIYPAVRARTKRRVTLLVAGQVCDAFRKKYAREYAARPEGVEFLGFLTDPEEFYRRTDIVVNPVSCGSGLKIKCVEGLARARPVVTTPIGAEGLEIAIGHGLFVSPTVEHFAQHVLQLIDDPNLLRRSSSQAYDFAEEHLSANAVFRSLEEWINCNCGDSPVLQVASSSH
ncbi:glycosyltransferase family 4 protein [Blastopirellula sp. J2-11]|uniref:glycosyltransferase family 4 protein n=1 Tax=Blastopirellula sp. J2-11 TaxID=2943192 RepID=UPI0021C9DAA1|nr:glycosyltransferase family 4 protein [Blastopirellula sp. J2-11]UUO06618.1 glycosyltransferase family 4 protein [Blastopirellula sp. J2-11]